MAIEHHVKDANAGHAFCVRHVEHAWRDRMGDANGFIDLVLEDRRHCIQLALECKRVRDATWIFFRSDGQAGQTPIAKAWVAALRENVRSSYFGWMDVETGMRCNEALFCAIRGQSTNDARPMIERIGGNLVAATQALADEDHGVGLRGQEHPRLYFSVIATTAKLQFARFSPNDISLTDGILRGAAFEEVPFVQLRKQLSAEYRQQDFVDGVPVVKSNERTVYVVRADAINEFLREFAIPDETLRLIRFG